MMRGNGGGHDTLTFEEALEAEERRLPEETAKILQDEYYVSSFHRTCSYLSRGIYVDQLLTWTLFFEKTQMLIMKSEYLFYNPHTPLTSVSTTHKIPGCLPNTPSIPNEPKYTRITPATRQRLNDYFEPHNRRLYEYLGADLGW